MYGFDLETKVGYPSDFRVESLSLGDLAKKKPSNE